MDIPIYNIIHDEDDMLGLNPLIAYFFFTEDTARYKAIMANPCDKRNIFRFEHLDKGAEMAHILKGTELGNALEDSNMIIRLFTANGRNDEYFIANIPYEGRPREMRPYVASLMNEVYSIDRSNISARLESPDSDEPDIRAMLSYVLDNLKGLKHDRSFYLNESEKCELKKLLNKIDRLDGELYPGVHYCYNINPDDFGPIAGSDISCDDFAMNDTACFEMRMSPACKPPMPKPARTEEGGKKEKARTNEKKQKKDLLEQIIAKVRSITDAADSMEMDELERIWKVLSGCNTSPQDSNDIAAGIFDNDRSAHLTYQICMSRKPEENYNINVRVDMFETEGRQHKKVYGLVIATNDETFRVHFTSIDSRMLYITTLSRLKYNIALTRDDMTIRKNLFEKKRKSIEDIGLLYDYLSNGSTKAFEDWYLKMENLNSRDQSYSDECHKRQENSVDGAISHANKDIFRQISSRYPKAMYYLGISNHNKEKYQVRLSQDEILLPPYLTTLLEKTYNV